MPLDIMVPYWGDPAMAREAVESVLAQTNPDWLLTVVDDAYPDPAIGEYLQGIDDPRIRYIRKEVNEGITANFRSCVEYATQDVVVLLGADDRLLPNYVDVVLAAHRRFPQADIIQPGVQVIDENGDVTSSLVDTVKRRVTMPRTRGPLLLAGEDLAASLLAADWLYWPSLAFRRERLVRTPFQDGRHVIQDLALVIDVICAGGSLLVEPTVCFSYRRHSSSASSATLLDGRRFEGERDYFRAAARQVARLGWRRAHRAAMLHWTSRVHALTLVPAALKDPQASARGMLGHALRPLGAAESS